MDEELAKRAIAQRTSGEICDLLDITVEEIFEHIELGATRIRLLREELELDDEGEPEDDD